MDTLSIILATNNIHKKQEIQHAFHTAVLSPKDLGILDFDPIESGETFEQNAMIKAQALHHILQTHANVPPHYVVIADDSGLCVEALHGAPGIFSARYAHMKQGNKQHGNASDKDNRNALIFALQQHGVWGSKAFFQCSIAYIIQHTQLQTNTQGIASGQCHGIVAIKELGRHGFGYDSMFYRDFNATQIACLDFSLHANDAMSNLDSLQHSLATLSLAQKTSISHRGQAIAKLQTLLNIDNTHA